MKVKAEIIRSSIQKFQSKYIVKYSFGFGIMTMSVFIYFIAAKKSLILAPSRDGFVQHYTGLVYYGKWLREIVKSLLHDHALKIPMWSFGLGYGSDIITTLHYNVIGDPLNLLSLLVPSRYTEYLYNFLIILRYYLAGLAFSFYCREKNGHLTDKAIMAGSFSYIFCGYAIFAFRHCFFLNPMIYLPLLLAGVERVLKKKSPYLFIWMVCISAVSNFYFFYMLAILTALYTVIRLFGIYHKVYIGREGILQLLKIFCYSLIGILLSGIVFLPVTIFFLGDTRSEAGYIFRTLYPLEYYEKILSGFISSNISGNWSFLGYTAISLFAIFLLFCKKGNKELKAGILILTVFILFPVFGHIMNGFSYVCNRWNFGYSFLVAYVLATMWSSFMELNIKEIQHLGMLLTAYSILGFLLRSERTTSFFVSLSLLISAFAIMLFWNAYKNTQNEKIQKNKVERWLFFITMCGISVNAFFQNSYFEINYPKSFVEYETAWDNLSNNQNPAVIATGGMYSDDFYRYACKHEGGGIRQNSSLLYGISNTQFYWSLQNGVIPQYFKEMADLNNMSYRFYGMDERTFLNELASVKYFVEKKSSPNLPYGYHHIGRIGNNYGFYDISENEYALPLGYTYETYLPREKYSKMSALDRAEALMQGVLLESSCDGYQTTTLTSDQQELEYTVECPEEVIWENGVFHVNAPEQTVTLKFTGSTGELNLLLEGLDYSEPSEANQTTENMTLLEKYLYYYDKLHEPENIDSLEMEITSGDTKKHLKYYTPYHIRYTGRKDFVVNLMYGQANRNEITITFPKEGTYSYSNLKVICQQMKQYTKWIGDRKENVLKNISIETNYISGTILLDKKKFLCLTVPYSKGWRAYVDGKKTDLLQANTMYMALPLKEGNHTIELTYCTPGLKLGILCTLVGCMLLIFIHLKKKNAE